MTLTKLNNKISKCRQCARLVSFREKIAKEKRRQYIDEQYWGKPITGYGDGEAQLLMIGLAPAAHGGNRTGRVFTGDKSADFLFDCLYKTGFSNQNISVSREDGLELRNLYLTTA
nr:uracil-DNA glycosylase [Pelagibacteraceae bacterium]